MKNNMNVEGVFIKTIVQEYISKVHPEENEFLITYLQEVEKRNFNTNLENGKDVPFGFGGSDLLAMFQSPIVIQILAGIWRDILVPLYKRILEKNPSAGEKNGISEQILKTLSRKKLRDYIRGQAKKKLLNDAEADELAERVVDWLRRHPEEIKHITTKST